MPRSSRGEASEAELALHVRQIAAGELGLLVEPALLRRALLLEDVVHPGLPAHDLARAGQLEALGGAPVGLHLGHGLLFRGGGAPTGARRRLAGLRTGTLAGARSSSLVRFVLFGD